MSVERKTYTYTPFTYADFVESADTTAAKDKKTNAENAYANYVNAGYTKSQDVINAETKKTNAENAYNTFFNNGFTYSKDASFNEIMNQILNREKFSYDVNGDALYQQYKDKYIQQGKMVSADVMGQAAAMTGGYGNSYAASVGNQAYQAALQNLNDVIPQLYQMALDKYNMEGQDLYNKYGMLSDDRSTEYGMWTDKGNRLGADRSYYSTEADNAFNKDYGMWADKGTMLNNDRTYYGNEYNNAYNRDYGKYSADRTLAYGEHTTSEGYKYQDVADANAFAQWKASHDLAQSQFDWQKEQANKSSYTGGGNTNYNNGGNDDGGFKKATFSRVDDSGNYVFYIDGKEQTFAPGVNPYTGTKNSDAKNGTFSNGYQPNNVNGQKLSKSGITDVVNGVTQNVWQTPDGTKWIWDGTKNKYLIYE